MTEPFSTLIGGQQRLPDKILHIENLVVKYGAARAIRGIGLSLASGEIVGILGRNGAGKSTLLRSVSGLVPIASGSIRFDGEDITNRRADEIARRGIGHVLEDRGIFGELTVGENLRASFTGVSRNQENQRIAAIVRHFPILDERCDQLGGSLSGGQQQMVAIARSLVRHPRALLLDEPSKGLAPAVVASVAALLRETVDQSAMGVLLVEQSFDLLWQLADRICVMSEGQIVLEGNKNDLTREMLRAAYFGDSSPISAQAS